MASGLADLLDRAVAQREVDLERGLMGRLGGEPRTGEEALRHAVVAEVLVEAELTPPGDEALPSEARDKAELLERTEMRERGGRLHAQASCDRVERDPARVGRAGRDQAKRLELPARQTLKRFHGGITTRRYLRVALIFRMD